MSGRQIERGRGGGRGLPLLSHGRGRGSRGSLFQSSSEPHRGGGRGGFGPARGGPIGMEILL
jgi:hypothetical protein